MLRLKLEDPSVRIRHCESFGDPDQAQVTCRRVRGDRGTTGWGLTVCMMMCALSGLSKTVLALEDVED